MRTPSRKERERESRRLAVLDAAEEVFAEKGFHDATVQEIAERAEFAVGTLYTMFQGKIAIYQELVEMRATQYVQRVQSTIQGLSDPREKVAAIIEAKLKFFDERRRFFRIFTMATSLQRSTQPQCMSERGYQIYADYIGAVAGVFAEGVQQGVFVDIDPFLLALVVEGTTNCIISQAIHTDGDRPAEATPESIQRVLFHGILSERERRS